MRFRFMDESSEVPRRFAGRPIGYYEYSEDVADRIEKLLSEGVPLAQICRKNGMPGVTTIHYWMGKYPEFADRIARSRNDGYDQIAVDALLIADESENDYFEDADGNRRFNPENVMRSKLRVETRLKLLAKWDRKRYGEEKGDTTVSVNVNNVVISDEKRAEFVRKKRECVERRLAAKNAPVIEDSASE